MRVLLNVLPHCQLIERFQNTAVFSREEKVSLIHEFDLM